MDDKTYGRFMAKVDKQGGGDDCWLWIGGVNGGGYPQMRVGGRVELAHRLIYLHHGGGYPPGMESRRTCGVKVCVNPTHIKIQRKDAEARVGVDAPHFHIWLPTVKAGGVDKAKGKRRPPPKHPVTETYARVWRAYTSRAGANAAINFASERKPRYSKRINPDTGEREPMLIAGIAGRWGGSFLGAMVSECLDPACSETRRRRVAAGLPEYPPEVLERYGRGRWGAVPRRGAGVTARRKSGGGIPSP